MRYSPNNNIYIYIYIYIYICWRSHIQIVAGVYISKLMDRENILNTYISTHKHTSIYIYYYYYYYERITLGGSTQRYYNIGGSGEEGTEIKEK